MPGTIQVSVLEIVALDSSSPISLVSIKVAIGKKEYETSVIEDFSFPLTSLRDNLIIKFLDAEGKEMSQTGVETKLIVEKGLWDDTFPLEGGGHVHMKLRFLLSAEERDQVRAMRHTALRKKQGGIMISNLTSPDTAIVDSSKIKISRSSSLKDDASDSQKSLLQSEAEVRPMVSGKISDNFLKNPKSVIKDVEEKPRSVQKLMDTISKDTKKESSPTSTTSAEKLKNQILPVNAVAKAGLGSSKSLDTSKPNEKPSPQGKADSAVRNMISVFESNPVENVKKPRIKPPPTKLRAFEDAVKSELRVPDTQITETTTDLKNELKVVHKEKNVNEENIAAEDLIRACTSETASVSGRITDEHSSRDDANPQNCRDESDNLVRNEKEAHPKELYEVNSQGVSLDESRSEQCLEDKNDGLVRNEKETQLNKLDELKSQGVLHDESKSEEGREDKNDGLVRNEEETHLNELPEVNSQGVLLDESKNEECREDKNDGLVRNEEETHLNELQEVNRLGVSLDELRSEECLEDKNDGLVRNEKGTHVKEFHDVNSQGVLLDESKSEECREDKKDSLVRNKEEETHLKKLHELKSQGVLLDESKSEGCREDKNDGLVRNEEETHLNELQELKSQGVLLDESKSEECREDKNDGLVRNELETHLKKLHELKSQSSLLDESKSKECREDKNEDLVRNEKETHLKELHEVNSQGILYDESKSEECREDKNDGLEDSGGWIFTDNSTRLCITTAGKQTMHVIGSCCAKIITSPKSESEEEVNKNEENSLPEIPAADETRRGPFRQVVRIAIMVGFAALVFFTRQRRTR